MTTNSIECLIAYWLSEKTLLNPGASIEMIIDAERQLDFVFPEDFKQLYSKVNGFSERDWLPNMFHLWPLELIVEEHEISSNKSVISFADYFIFSHTIGFDKNQNAIVKNHGNQTDFLCNSYIDAILLINTNAASIY